MEQIFALSVSVILKNRLGNTSLPFSLLKLPIPRTRVAFVNHVSTYLEYLRLGLVTYLVRMVPASGHISATQPKKYNIILIFLQREIPRQASEGQLSPEKVAFAQTWA